MLIDWNKTKEQPVAPKEIIPTTETPEGKGMVDWTKYAKGETAKVAPEEQKALDWTERGFWGKLASWKTAKEIPFTTYETLIPNAWREQIEKAGQLPPPANIEEMSSRQQEYSKAFVHGLKEFAQGIGHLVTQAVATPILEVAYHTTPEKVETVELPFGLGTVGTMEKRTSDLQSSGFSVPESYALAITEDLLGYSIIGSTAYGLGKKIGDLPKMPITLKKPYGEKLPPKKIVGMEEITKPGIRPGEIALRPELIRKGPKIEDIIKVTDKKLEKPVPKIPKGKKLTPEALAFQKEFKVTDLPSLKKYGDTIAKMLKIDKPISWTWRDKGAGGYHHVTRWIDDKPMAHKILVRGDKGGLKRPYPTTFTFKGEKIPAASQRGIKHVIVHELLHIKKPPIVRPGKRRFVHHPAFKAGLLKAEQLIDRQNQLQRISPRMLYEVQAKTPEGIRSVRITGKELVDELMLQHSFPGEIKAPIKAFRKIGKTKEDPRLLTEISELGDLKENMPQVKTPVGATNKQKQIAHILSKKRELTAEEWNTLKEQLTGKKTMKDMSFEEAQRVISHLMDKEITVKKPIFTSTEVIANKNIQKLKKDMTILSFWKTPRRMIPEVYQPFSIANRTMLLELETLNKTLTDLFKKHGVKRHKESDYKIGQYLDGKKVVLTDAEMIVAKNIRGLFDSLFERTGAPPERYLNHYITWIREQFPKGYKDLPYDVEGTVPKEIWLKFLQPREAKIAPSKLSVFDALNVYIPVTLRKIYYDPALLKVKPVIKNLPQNKAKYARKWIDKVLGRPGATDLLTSAFLNKVEMWMAEMSYKMTGKPRFVKLPTPTRISRNICRVYYNLYLGLAIDSALKNLTQPILTVSRVGLFPVTRAYMRLLRPQVPIWASKKFPRFTRITEAIVPGAKVGRLARQEVINSGVLKEFINVLERQPTAFKFGIRKLEDINLTPFQVAEFINRGVTYLAAKEVFIKKYGSKLSDVKAMALVEKNARKFARDITKDTQFEYGVLGTSPYLQGPVTRVATQFLSFPMKLTETLLHWGTTPGQRMYLMRYIVATGMLTYTTRAALGIDLATIWGPTGMYPSPSQIRQGLVPFGQTMMTALEGDWDELIERHYPRYPVKLFRVIEGLQQGEVRDEKGRLRFETTTKEQVFWALGLTTLNTKQRRVAYDDIRDLTEEYTEARNAVYKNLIDNKNAHEAVKIMNEWNSKAIKDVFKIIKENNMKLTDKNITTIVKKYTIELTDQDFIRELRYRQTPALERMMGIMR